MKQVEESVRPSSIEVAPNLTMADFTKVLVTNVLLATAIVVLLFHAPVAWSGLGAAVSGLVIWTGMRFVRTRRPR